MTNDSDREVLKKSPQGSHLLLIAVLLLSAICFFYGLGRLPFVGADEPRYSRVAEEMVASGDYVIPHLQGRPWMEKPPLAFWAMAASFHLFGTGEWQARLPSAVLALSCVLAVYWTGKKLEGEASGLAAAVMLATMSGFFVFARAATTDMPLAAALTWGFCCWLLACESETATVRARTLLTLFAAFCFGSAVLAKGLVGALFPLAILTTAALVTRRFQIRPIQLAGALVVFAATALPWHWLAYRRRGFDFIATYLINHHFARYVTELHHHVRPFYFFLLVVIALVAPWTGLLIALFGRKQQRLDYRPALLWTWFLFPIFFFSLSTAKLAGYILPVLPPLALLLGSALAHRVVCPPDHAEGRSIRAALLVNALLVALLAGGLGWAAWHYYRSLAAALPAALSLLAGAVVLVFYGRSGRLLQAVLSLAFFTALAVAALVQWFVPVLAIHHSAKSQVLRAMPLLAEGQVLLLYRYFHHTAPYYSDFRIAEEKLDTLPQLAAYLKAHPAQRWLVLTTPAGSNELAQMHGYTVGLIRAEGNLVLLAIASR
ncbi:MAG: ArnT family glycosyltransferase [Acidobacteriota bacterium]